MIVIDYSQTAISNLMAELGGRTDVEINLPLIRHMIINSIRGYKKKFGRTYGELVLACDSKNYWRKEIFPFYKKHRKKDREDSGYDWKAIFEVLDTVRKEIDEFFPYKVLCIEGAEADDIIATMAKYSQTAGANPLFDEGEPFLVISGDHDFVQLQKYPNVKQYSPIQKKFVVPDTTPERALLEHTFRGDKGDGIPNVLSADESVYENIRQRPISSKKIEEWIKDSSKMPSDIEFQTRLMRNNRLINFEYIPVTIEQEILRAYIDTPSKDRTKLFNYFIANRMKNMMELIEEF